MNAGYVQELRHRQRISLYGIAGKLISWLIAK